MIPWFMVIPGCGHSPPPPGPDLDGDGLSPPEDCNDADPALGGPEKGNDGVDNDCDGAIDCDDPDLLNEEWDGDVLEGDLPDFCDGYCTRPITGSIAIKWVDYYPPSVSSLSSLWCVTAAGNLDLTTPRLPTLSGLENLRSLDGIFLFDAFSLLDITALQGLTSLTGAVSIHHAPLLDSLDGLEAARTLESLSIYDSGRLRDLTALGAVEEVTHGVTFWGNAFLESLHGLEGVRSIGSLDLDTNRDLEDVTALHGLESVAHRVTIIDNESLGDEAAQALVDEIDDIGGTVRVEGNGTP
jgi:hypothetical protein